MITTFFPSRPSAIDPSVFVPMPDREKLNVPVHIAKSMVEMWPGGIVYATHGGVTPADLAQIRETMSRLILWMSQVGSIPDGTEKLMSLIDYCIDNGCHLRWREKHWSDQ